MPNDKSDPAPFIGATHRHDLLAQLAGTRIRAFDSAVNDAVANGIRNPEEVKLDGKNGGMDGISVSLGGIEVADETVYSPWQPPKFPKGKESKEGKESKDSKESKEGKESKDSKEAGKESSDGGKMAGSEASDPFSRFGEVERLNWSLMNQVAQQHANGVRGFIKSVQMF
ncbi:hypothetical protein G4G27_01095 [Sphingomonas sp. So64.6b]|uniref:hypothetical protein n=1 Tax=Sphingomonas sp. So64.6b TaxID=2997354 RepID=UPI001604827A|nr:hypothetical protein [Sphingomonas sp. So64.6b]QNA82760.1 hypothetical protein G4G27_01095 [Sphingomonas sp. So64.6b]